MTSQISFHCNQSSSQHNTNKVVIFWQSLITNIVSKNTDKNCSTQNCTVHTVHCGVMRLHIFYWRLFHCCQFVYGIQREYEPFQSEHSHNGLFCTPQRLRLPSMRLILAFYICLFILYLTKISSKATNFKFCCSFAHSLFYNTYCRNTENNEQIYMTRDF